MLRLAELRPETRYASSLPAKIVVTEKSAAVEFLPSRSGVASWALFGKDPAFLKWADDLYEHEWNQAKAWHP